jgi:hypothetical protein
MCVFQRQNERSKFIESEITPRIKERRFSMSNTIRIALIVVCLLVLFGLAGALSTHAQDVKSVSPELVGQLTKQLSVTPKQAAGGAGALFGLAKTKLPADQFSQVANVVPGMDGLLKAAPKVKQSAAANAMGSMTGALPGGLGGLGSVASQFKTLGLSPDMVTKFVPVMTQFVQTKGGAGVADLLAGALK